MDSGLVNPNPEIFSGAGSILTRSPEDIANEADETVRDPVDALEIYEHLRTIKDPEHPNTLEELRVVDPTLIKVDEVKGTVFVEFTPTVPHCSMTTLIGLCIRVKLQRCISPRFKIDVRLTPGSHNQELQVNKQLADKERVAAALENDGLLNVVASCLNEFC